MLPPTDPVENHRQPAEDQDEGIDKVGNDRIVPAADGSNHKELGTTTSRSGRLVSLDVCRRMLYGSQNTS